MKLGLEMVLTSSRNMIRTTVSILALGMLTACSKTDAAPTVTSADKPTAAAAKTHEAPAKAAEGSRLSFPGTEEGAKQLVQTLVKADSDHRAITQSLVPSKADCEAIFDGDLATKAHAQYQKLFASEDAAIKGKPDQTEVVIWKATTDELRKGTGDSGQFPGGYKKVAEKLKTGLTFYRFKFVKPGETLGMAHDGLVHVNGHWVIVPKPWKIAG